MSLPGKENDQQAVEAVLGEGWLGNGRDRGKEQLQIGEVFTPVRGSGSSRAS